MKRISGFARGAAATACAALALATAPGEAGAQFGDWGLTWVGVAETGGDEVTLVLGQVGATPGGLGIRPTVSLQAYWLDHPGGSTVAVQPAAGLRYRAQSGFLQAKVGYSFKSDEDEQGAFPFFGGAESGVTTSAQAEYWDGGAFGLSGIASYNWASQYMWSRARGTVRVLQGTWGSLHPGAEFVWQGEMDDTEPNYSATQYGGVLQWNSGNRLIMVFGGGVKQLGEDFGDPDADDSTWYLKYEIVLSD